MRARAGGPEQESKPYLAATVVPKRIGFVLLPSQPHPGGFMWSGLYCSRVHATILFGLERVIRLQYQVVLAHR